MEMLFLLPYIINLIQSNNLDVHVEASTLRKRKREECRVTISCLDKSSVPKGTEASCHSLDEGEERQKTFFQAALSK